jgi:hypothetical protein
VLLAVENQGVTSFLRLSEAGFGEERLYEKIPLRPLEAAAARGAGAFKKGRKNRGGKK